MRGCHQRVCGEKHPGRITEPRLDGIGQRDGTLIADAPC